VQYSWGSTGATNGISTFRVTSGPNNCHFSTTGQTWQTSMGALGGTVGLVQSCQAGDSYDIEYKPTDATGKVIGNVHVYLSVPLIPTPTPTATPAPTPTPWPMDYYVCGPDSGTLSGSDGKEAVCHRLDLYIEGSNCYGQYEFYTTDQALFQARIAMVNTLPAGSKVLWSGTNSQGWLQVNIALYLGVCGPGTH
jgi:hypothetical protein